MRRPLFRRGKTRGGNKEGRKSFPSSVENQQERSARSLARALRSKELFTAHIKKTIDTKSVDKLSRILGTFDENLTLLSRELNLVTYVDGVKIQLEGEEKDVACGEEVLAELLKFAGSGDSVDRSRIV